MSKVRFKTNGIENGKRAYLAQKYAVGSWMTFASIVYDGCEWVITKSSGRIDRRETLELARDECLKIV